ncbi:CHAP domain-containing protein [Curtanaerobium respiraculi]|uniref:CHAP domain-containing protein n=1 Tax=Curtanaerobium respiraculi TaxID=2949669 RepID=UPI0024B325F5|nr:CHAP domain-containing protein [Curtanaerobium respiraculi]
MDGIEIDINAAPYTTFAGYSYGSYAYTSEGCAWFASARVNDLTGKGNRIWSGRNWYTTQYAEYGLSRGQEIQAKALACYENHVVVIEKVSGIIVTISEGGRSSAGVEHGCCQITHMTVDQVKQGVSGYGRFLGFVYLQSASNNDDEDDTDDPGNGKSMYRLYNPNSGEHFYTSSTYERNHVRAAGWVYEGVGWTAPAKSTAPVYRLYNGNGGEHHYTMSIEERDSLVSVGWSDEGIGWYSDDDETTPLYRQYNPNAFANNHNYTTSVVERDKLVSLGWIPEGIGWYGIG